MFLLSINMHVSKFYALYLNVVIFFSFARFTCSYFYLLRILLNIEETLQMNAYRFKVSLFAIKIAWYYVFCLTTYNCIDNAVIYPGIHIFFLSYTIQHFLKKYFKVCVSVSVVMFVCFIFNVKFFLQLFSYHWCYWKLDELFSRMQKWTKFIA